MPKAPTAEPSKKSLIWERVSNNLIRYKPNGNYYVQAKLGGRRVRESLDTTIKSVDDVTQIMGQAPLGAVPFDARAKDQPLVALDQKAVRSEAFRSTRTNLAFADVDKPPQVGVITSAVASEGKTTSACNLAITMAQSGQRVVLVECDLRRPRVAGQGQAQN